MTQPEKSTYYTTALAGFHVAGRRIPSERVGGTERPIVGHPLELTADEAAYELSSGTITRQAPPAPGAPTIAFAPVSTGVEAGLNTGSDA